MLVHTGYLSSVSSRLLPNRDAYEQTIPAGRPLTRGATAMAATRTSVCARMAAAGCRIRCACRDPRSSWGKPDRILREAICYNRGVIVPWGVPHGNILLHQLMEGRMARVMHVDIAQRDIQRTVITDTAEPQCYMLQFIHILRRLRSDKLPACNCRGLSRFQAAACSTKGAVVNRFEYGHYDVSRLDSAPGSKEAYVSFTSALGPVYHAFESHHQQISITSRLCGCATLSSWEMKRPNDLMLSTFPDLFERWMRDVNYQSDDRALN